MTTHQPPAGAGPARPDCGPDQHRASRPSLLRCALGTPLWNLLWCPAPSRMEKAQVTTQTLARPALSKPSSLLLSLTKPWEIGGGGVPVVEAIIGFRARLVPSAAGWGRRPAGGRTRTTGGRG